MEISGSKLFTGFCVWFGRLAYSKLVNFAACISKAATFKKVMLIDE
jgi:hypothetical protein